MKEINQQYFNKQHIAYLKCYHCGHYTKIRDDIKLSLYEYTCSECNRFTRDYPRNSEGQHFHETY